MAKISQYAIDSTPSLSDKLIGTDVNDSNITKNYLISDLIGLVNLSGYVTLGTAQTITGQKTFTQPVTILDIPEAAPGINNVLVPDGSVIKYRPLADIIAEDFAFGSFFDEGNQTSIASATEVLIGNTSLSNSVAIQNNSQITFFRTGVFNISVSVQLKRISGATASNVYFWLRQNGTEVPSSTKLVHFNADTEYALASFNFVVENQTIGDYCEIMWYEDNGDIQLFFTDTGLPTGVPEIPSVAVTVNQIS